MGTAGNGCAGHRPHSASGHTAGSQVGACRPRIHQVPTTCPLNRAHWECACSDFSRLCDGQGTLPPNMPGTSQHKAGRAGGPTSVGRQMPTSVGSSAHCSQRLFPSSTGGSARASHTGLSVRLPIREKDMNKALEGAKFSQLQLHISHHPQNQVLLPQLQAARTPG